MSETHRTRLEITRESLSEHTRTQIQKRLKQGGASTGIDLFLAEIDHTLKYCAEWLTKGAGASVFYRTKQELAQVRAIRKALSSLTPRTLSVLSELRLYHPFFDGTALEQVLDSLEDGPLNGTVVPLHGAVDDLIKACEVYEKTFVAPPAGAPKDMVLHGLVDRLMEAFHRCTGLKATSTPSTAFDDILGYVLHSATNTRRKEENSQSKLIRSVIRGRKRMENTPLDAATLPEPTKLLILARGLAYTLASPLP
jgi:hypothetical protein